MLLKKLRKMFHTTRTLSSNQVVTSLNSNSTHSDQINFVFDGEDDKVVGPICLSIEAFGSGKDDEQKAILRSKKVDIFTSVHVIHNTQGTFRFFIPSCNSNKEALKVVKTMFPELANIKFTETYHHVNKTHQCRKSRYRYM
jgi:hypothetical protein